MLINTENDSCKSLNKTIRQDTTDQLMWKAEKMLKTGRIIAIDSRAIEFIPIYQELDAIIKEIYRRGQQGSRRAKWMVSELFIRVLCMKDPIWPWGGLLASTFLEDIDIIACTDERENLYLIENIQHLLEYQKEKISDFDEVSGEYRLCNKDSL